MKNAILALTLIASTLPLLANEIKSRSLFYNFLEKSIHHVDQLIILK